MKGSLAAISWLVLPALVVFAPVRPAAAAPRRVVVVNTAADAELGRRAAALVRTRLVAIEGLAPLPSGDLSRAFEEPLPARTRADLHFDEAQLRVSRAREAVARFAYDEALAELGRAEAGVLDLVPARRGQLILAQANFIAGRVYLDRGDRERAMVAFRAVRRLDPDQKELDPALYLDEVVRAFATAGAPQPANAVVDLSTTYDGAVVFVDGVALPPATRTTSLPPGLHYFAAVYPDHRPVGRRLVLEPDTTTEVKLRLIPEDIEERARGLRRRALGAEPPNEVEIARAAATLAGVDAVVIIRSDAGRSVATVFDGRTETLGSWQPLAPEPGESFFTALLPPAIEPLPPIEIPPPPPPAPPWYEKRWGKAAIIGGSGVALTVIGLLARSLTSSDGTQNTDVLCIGFSPCP